VSSSLLHRYQPSYLCSLCFVCFSSFWLTGILPVSPIYFFVFWGFFFRFITYKQNIKIDYTKFFFVCVYVFFMSLNNFIFSKEIKVYLSYMLFLPFYFFCDLNLRNLNLKSIKKIVRVYLLFNCFFLFSETIYRLFNGLTNEFAPWMLSNPHLLFYQFKEPGLIYEDSNGSGIIALCVCGVLFFVNSSKFHLFKNKIVVSFVLYFSFFFTFSRAALFGFFCYIAYYYISKLKKNFRIIAVFFLTILLFCLIVLFMFDNSFNTKLIIFQETIEYILTSNIYDLLWGHGQLSSEYVLDYGYAHNILSLYIIEYGLISFISFISLLVIIIRDVGLKTSLCVFMPYSIASLSFTPIVVPYFFASLALLKHIQRVLNEK